MSLILALALMQSGPVIGTVPDRNAELDAAHACLVAETSEWLQEFNWQPEQDERWRWATEIAEQCDAELARAANSENSIQLYFGDFAEGGISKREMLRTEAKFYVDRLIRTHFEVQS